MYAQNVPTASLNRGSLRLTPIIASQVACSSNSLPVVDVKMFLSFLQTSICILLRVAIAACTVGYT